MKRLLFVLVSLFLFVESSFAQTAEMATGMRSDGKIYVVVGVIVLIFVVLFGYLALIDQRVRKLEKNQNEK
jgi:hypothetical protein